MTCGQICSAEPAGRARLAARLLAVAPDQLRGANLRTPAGAAREAWLSTYVSLAGQQTAIRVPLSVTDDALDGGLDLSATLVTGRPVYQTGIIQAASQKTLLLTMAERWTRHSAARVAAAMDPAQRSRTFCVVMFDEGIGDDERVPEVLLDRVAFHLSGLEGMPADRPTMAEVEEIARARERLSSVVMATDMIALLIAVADRLGIASSRPVHFAMHAARAHASLDGRESTTEEDVIAAAALVLAPRATQFPQSLEESEAQQDTEPDVSDSDASACDLPDDGILPDRVVEACAAHLPKNLLESFSNARTARRPAERGRKHVGKSPSQHGPAIGVRKSLPRRGERISLSATLLAAAPWQGIRRREARAGAAAPPRHFHFRKDDVRLYRRKSSQRSTTVFSVDASGSSAVHRLAEAKGAVEQLLAQSYVRRDRVALVAFRGRGAEVLLHPTRSLARARRALAELPGGGTTPLASGIREAHALASSVLRAGQQCRVVFLTDGCANVDGEGRGGRAGAIEDALQTARRLRADDIATIVIDSSPKPSPQSLALAEALGALYVPLPHGSSQSISEAVRKFGRAGRIGQRARFG